MPNWCSNTLEVSGSSDDVIAFKNAIRDDKRFDITLPFPCPEELANTPAMFLSKEISDDDVKRAKMWKVYAANKAKYGATNWYEWSLNNWGTKWAPTIDDIDISPDDTFMMLRFDSAWGPPLKLIEHLSEQFPTAGFVLSYDEPGMCFGGAASFYSGKMIFDGYFEYHDIEGYDDLANTADADHEVWDQMTDLVDNERDISYDNAETRLELVRQHVASL